MVEEQNPLLKMYRRLNLWEQIYDSGLGKAIGHGEVAAIMQDLGNYVDENTSLEIKTKLSPEITKLNSSIKNLKSHDNLTCARKVIEYLIEENIFLRNITIEQYQEEIESVNRIDESAAKYIDKRFSQNPLFENSRKKIN